MFSFEFFEIFKNTFFYKTPPDDWFCKLLNGLSLTLTDTSFPIISAELQSVSEQLTEGGKNSHEVEKLRRKLGIENEELQAALEEAEAALEQEESKLLKVQLELTQFKQSTERKMNEKDEEMEGLRKNHARQLEALQNTIDAEQKAKSESQKQRKKQDADIADLEARLDVAERSSGDYLKTIKKLQAQIKVVFDPKQWASIWLKKRLNTRVFFSVFSRI